MQKKEPFVSFYSNTTYTQLAKINLKNQISCYKKLNISYSITPSHGLKKKTLEKKITRFKPFYRC